MAIKKLIDFREIGLEFFINNLFHTGYNYDLFKYYLDSDYDGFKYNLFETYINHKHSITTLNNKNLIKPYADYQGVRRLPNFAIQPQSHHKNGVLYVGFRILYSEDIQSNKNNIGFKYPPNLMSYENKSYNAGQNVYHELEINYIDKKVRIYSDNVLTAEFTPTNINFILRLGLVGNYHMGDAMMTDIYVVHDKIDDPNPTGRLGPISIENITISQFMNPSSELSVQSDNYSTVNGETNPVTVVNYPFGWGETINSGVVLKNNNPALEARVNSTDVDNLSNGTIKAIQVTSYTNKDASSESEVTTRIKMGYDELANSKSTPKDLDLDKYYKSENGRIIMTDFGSYGDINKTNLKWLQIFNEVKKQT